MSSTSVNKLGAESEAKTVEWLGQKFRSLVSSMDSNGTYVGQITECEPGFAGQAHCHSREDEVILVAQGGLTIRVGSQVIRSKAGDLVMAPAGLPQQIVNESDGVAAYISLLIPGDIEPAFAAANAAGPTETEQIFGDVGVKFLSAYDPKFKHPGYTLPLREPFVCRDGTGQRVFFGGNSYTIKLPGTLAAGRLSIVQLDLAPGASTPTYALRRSDEMLFVLDGDDLSLYSDGEVLSAASGDSMFVPRETVHGLRNNSDRKAQIVMVNNPAGLDRFLVEAGTPGMMSSTPPAFGEEQQEKVMNVAPRYAMEFKWDVEF